MHSDTTLVKRRRRNYLALSLRHELRRRQLEEAWMAVAADGLMADGQQVSDELRRVCRKLDEQKRHYIERKQLRPPPWVPTQKMPRLLTTSASACRRLLKKAKLSGACLGQWEVAEAHANALADIRRKWHIPPAFSVEFIAYFLDRNDRLREMRDTAEKLEEENKNLIEEETALRIKYDEVLKRHSDITAKGADLKQTIQKYHSAILSACPNKSLPNLDEIFRKAQVKGKQQAPQQIQQPMQMMVPTAAALKMGVGFPLKVQHRPHGVASARGMLSGQNAKTDNTLMLNECGICRQRRDQHLMAKCDTCRLYYHLSCLNPPLNRLPKKSKLYGWQCSECDKTSDSETEQVKTPRRSRTGRFKSFSSGGGGGTQDEVDSISLPSSPPKLKIKPMEEDNQDEGMPHRSSQHLHRRMSLPTNEVSSTGTGSQLQVVLNPSILCDGVSSHKSAKKRRREKHRNRCANGDGYSPGLEGFPFKEHKRKRKKKSFDLDDELPHPRITIKEGVDGTVAVAGPSITTAASRPSRISRGSTGTRSPPRAGPKASPRKGGGTGDTCDVCGEAGSINDSVKCDECQKYYHFSCLDPPLKKSPKKRGYSWHCADCDPTGSD
nr:unnamed protein product [Callosobruchus analis]